MAGGSRRVSRTSARPSRASRRTRPRRRPSRALIAAEIPARDIAIVGQGLRSIERVTGRLGYATAARSGAVNGMLLGLLFSAILVIGSPSVPIQAFVGVLFVGIAIGMLLSIVTYSFVRRRRDFASVMQVVAERYEVTVTSASLSRARQALGQQAAPRRRSRLPRPSPHRRLRTPTPTRSLRATASACRRPSRTASAPATRARRRAPAHSPATAPTARATRHPSDRRRRDGRGDARAGRRRPPGRPGRGVGGRRETRRRVGDARARPRSRFRLRASLPRRLGPGAVRRGRGDGPVQLPLRRARAGGCRGRRPTRSSRGRR